MKWQFAANSVNDKKYVICNADEGDPGAFMDAACLKATRIKCLKAWQSAVMPSVPTKAIFMCVRNIRWLSSACA